MPDNNSNILGPLLIFIAAVSWSTAGLFTRLVTTDIPTTLFWRSLFGGFCVLAIALMMQHRFDLRQAFRFSLGEFIIAALSTAGMICFISSFFFTTIANVSLVYGTMPLVTYLLALVFLRDAPSVIAGLCSVLAAVGVAVMTAGNSAIDDYLGILLALGMTFFMAALTVATKFFPTADTVKATYLSAFLGSIVVTPFATFSAVTGSDYGWLCLYGLVNVGLGFGIYLLGVGRVTALAAALIGLVEIPLAPVWAWLLFNEIPNTTVVLCGTMILAAAVIYLLETNRRRIEATT